MLVSNSKRSFNYTLKGMRYDMGATTLCSDEGKYFETHVPTNVTHFNGLAVGCRRNRGMRQRGGGGTAPDMIRRNNWDGCRGAWHGSLSMRSNSLFRKNPRG